MNSRRDLVDTYSSAMLLSYEVSCTDGTLVDSYTEIHVYYAMWGCCY